MKKTLVALAALAATSAFAQSTVTLSGSINYGMHRGTDGATSVGGLKGDRNHLTFAAVEDMGNGTKAAATLQARYDSAASGAGYVNSTTGVTNDSLFEQTKVSLSNTTYGEVAVGRFTNAIGVAPVHALEDSRATTASHQAANGRLSGQFQYMSPAFAGVQVWALTAKATSNCYMSAGSGAGYVKTYNYCQNDTAANSTLGNKDLTATGLNYNNGPITAQYYQLSDLTGAKSTKIAGVYDAKVAKFYVNQFNQKDDISFRATNGVMGATAAFTTTNGMKAHKATEMAVAVPYGKFTGILGKLSFDSDLTATAGTAPRKTGWAVLYDMSKRTQLQYYGSVVKNGTAQAGASGLTNGALATGASNFVGIEHKF
ncbi:MAG: hypothetical protein RLZ36_88 [Pseudomonadota bacterium]